MGYSMGTAGTVPSQLVFKFKNPPLGQCAGWFLAYL